MCPVENDLGCLGTVLTDLFPVADVVDVVVGAVVDSVVNVDAATFCCLALLRTRSSFGTTRLL
jgi:hypothetical protein